MVISSNTFLKIFTKQITLKNCTENSFYNSSINIQPKRLLRVATPYFPLKPGKKHCASSFLKNKRFISSKCKADKSWCNLIFWKSCNKTNYKVIRPLLSCSRKTVTAVCALIKIPIYPDTSNFYTYYSRNRLRKQILPSLIFFFNPQTENSIFKFSEFQLRDKFLSSLLTLN